MKKDELRKSKLYIECEAYKMPSKYNETKYFGLKETEDVIDILHLDKKGLDGQVLVNNSNKLFYFACGADDIIGVSAKLGVVKELEPSVEKYSQGGLSQEFILKLVAISTGQPANGIL